MASTPITRHSKEQESITHNEINQSIKTNLELTQVLELADKEIESIIIVEFCMFKKFSGDIQDFKRPKSNL